MSESLILPWRQRIRSYGGYGLLLLVVTAVYLLIRAYGDTLSAPAPHPLSPDTFPQVHVNDFVHVLLALVFVIAAARGLGLLFRYIHQPPVVGEMIAGILLGPSFLGHFSPHFASYILPQSIAPLLNVIAQFGVILYMFLVGLELDLSGLRGRAHSTIAISHASIVLPFLLGAGLSLLLYPRLSNSGVSFTAYSLFLGTSMSVTAFPVLARILTDRGISKSKLGSIALACAAIDDVSAWCLLAFVVSVTKSRAGSALPTILLAIGFIAGMLLVARPLIVRLTRFIDSKGRMTQGSLAFVLLAILLSSLATESIGIHSIFGAFVLGAIIPHRSSLARDIAGKLEDFVIVFLLPAFFAFTGLRTQIGLVNGAKQWFFCALIIAVASVGKFGGSAIAARLSGLSWRQSSALGVLMNTRGLMELIVLNIGLEFHVISPVLFAMLVLMALATTFATTPMLHFIARGDTLKDSSDEPQPVASHERSGVLVAISNPHSVGNLLDVALALTRPADPPPLVLAIERGAAAGLRSGLAETRNLPPSRSPLVTAALDAAWARDRSVTPRAIWGLDQASDILGAAERAQVRWLVLESRRSSFPHRSRDSVVNQVLEQSANRAMSTVVLPAFEMRDSSAIGCVFEPGSEGRACLELAYQLAGRTEKTLKVILPPGDQAKSSFAHESNKLSIPLESVAITIHPDPAVLIDVQPGCLLVIGRSLFSRTQGNELARRATLLVVQGAGEATEQTESAPLQVQPATV